MAGNPDRFKEGLSQATQITKGDGPMPAPATPTDVFDDTFDLDDTFDDVPAPPKRTRRLKTIWVDDYVRDLSKPGLIDGVIPIHGLSVFFGESSCGKTFVVIDMVCRIAAGIKWRDYHVTQGKVLYIAAEAPKSVLDRIDGWRRWHGVEHLPILVVQSPVNLLDRSDIDEIKDIVEEILTENEPVRLVVVDTLARAMLGNENSTEEMSRLVNACGDIAGEHDCHLIIVHHSGKDTSKGARGSGSLRAGVDAEFEITRESKTSNIRKIRSSKQRDGKDNEVFAFTLETIDLEENAVGRMIDTCVVVETDAPADRDTRQKLGTVEKPMFDVLTALLEKEGEDGEGPLFDGKVVKLEHWKAQGWHKLTQTETRTKEQAFKRIVESLSKNRYIATHSGLVGLY
jgi:hypothetical protein